MRISDWSSDVCSSDLSGYRQRDRQIMFFPRYFKFPSQDMAIDLGTANTVVYLRGRGIVLNEPSVVAIETQYGIRRVKAVGNDATLMMGKDRKSTRQNSSN